MARSVANNGRPIETSQRRTTQRANRDWSNNQYNALLNRLFSLGFGPGGPLRSVGLTSSQAGEGVTTVACNLALQAASVYDLSVLLIDANQANRQLHRIFRLPASPGFTDFVFHGGLQQECIHDMSARPLKLWPRSIRNSLRGPRGLFGRGRVSQPAAPRLSILPFGSQDVGNRELANSLCQEFLNSVSADFDLVVLDLTPVWSEVTWRMSFADLDGVLFVLQAETTTDVAAQRSLRELQSQGTQVLGVAFNQVRRHLPKWVDRRLAD